MTNGLRQRKRKTQPSLDEVFPPGEPPASGNTGFKRARELRAIATPAERKLWNFLRGKRIAGLKFRRQHPMGPYYADFVCLSARLVVEIDGSQHFDGKQADHDRARTAWLESRGFEVVRFANGDVLRNTETVIERIDEKLRSRTAGA